MFAIRLLKKAKYHLNNQQNVQQGSVAPADLDPHIDHHCGIPSTSSILAFDPIQRLMAVGTLDGRIKVIGGDNVEGLLISPKQLPYKNIEFLHNQGFLVSVSNENDIQVWDLEHRRIASSLKWEFNITAFSVVPGTCFMYVGDEYGMVSVLKYDAAERKVLQLPYHIPANSLADAAGVSLPDRISVVGVSPQPCTSGNRLLIAYANGLIVLWDVSETRVVLVRGYKDLQLKDGGVVDSSGRVINELPQNTSELGKEEKEISSLCWASPDGSILAVGYVDGDILLWNMLSASSLKGPQAGISSQDVVRLQLSSGKRKLPVIVLHWSANSRSNNDRGGQLFVYGGDEMGSEEVLTALSLEWSSGKDVLRCTNRLDLTLNGSFADMILVPNAGARENNNPGASLFLLTNPGQLHVYDDTTLAAFSSQQEKNHIRAMPFPVVVPMLEPYMSVAKLMSVPMGGISSKALLEISSNMKTTLAAGKKWPLTGGITKQLSCSEDDGVERVYMAGYQDGSVRLWNATYPVLSPIVVLEGEVQNIQVAGASTPVTVLDFCFFTSSLAVGSECGLVRICKFDGNSEQTSFHFVSETKREVHCLHQEKGIQYTAAFSIVNSPVRTLQYANSGAKLTVGFECGQVAMLDMSSSSVLFLTDCVSESRSPVISMDVMAFTDICSLINNSKRRGSKSPKDPADGEPIKEKDPADGEVFILTRDSHIVVLDSVTGNTISTWKAQLKKGSTAISMYIIEAFTGEHSEKLSKDSSTHTEQLPEDNNTLGGVNSQVEPQSSSETKNLGKRSLDSLIVLCCVDVLHVHSLKSVIQGDNNSIRKVNLAKPCCWTTTFKSTNEKASGIILFYQTGLIEIRSLPDLEVVGESSLMSILRWSFKSNMEKTICSSDRGQIAVANGSELAFISFLASESDSRFSDSLPCLHDKVLAAAADAAISFSSSPKKKQGSPGILGIIKGFKGEKVGNKVDPTTSPRTSKFVLHLESIFSSVPFSYQPLNIPDFEVIEELNIDDIQIDDPMPVASTSSNKSKIDKRDKEKEREKLFDGATIEKPKLRTAAEIMAKYRKAGDASAAASQARDKLIERQEKLERIRKNTEELNSGAENFASLANELVKKMEARKWWQI